ncbi:MAG: LD-carboxypeptidase [Desulfobacteraceae bacterium]|nr:LD-carboxypeptidase [Desulfobacteraceae bacterium]MBC2718685.1 LD-carboxypeptidase [Desulfobacteraceae bacterium]
MEIIKPMSLVKGDNIGIFSPSEPLTEDRRDQLKKGIALFESRGYRVKLSEYLFESDYYMAGSAEKRASDFNALLEAPEVKVLWTSWGGKSANQILDLINWDSLKKTPKIIIGFSDTTNIINASYAITKVVSFHGPHVAGKIAECSNSTIELGFNAFTKGEVVTPADMEAPVIIRSGSCEGRLVGGNLKSFILSNLGTKYEPELKQSIFFWETGSGSPQEIDQYLTYLKLCGVFDKISGMLVGDLSNCKDSRDWGGRSMHEVILDVTKEHNFPIFHIPAFGHGKVPNMVLPIGCKARINTDTFSFELLEPCVEV